MSLLLPCTLCFYIVCLVIIITMYIMFNCVIFDKVETNKIEKLENLMTWRTSKQNLCYDFWSHIDHFSFLFEKHTYFQEGAHRIKKYQEYIRKSTVISVNMNVVLLLVCSHQNVLKYVYPTKTGIFFAFLISMASKA